MTREGRRERAYLDFCNEAGNYFSLFASLFKSAIGFKGVSKNARREGATDDYLMSLLFEDGVFYYYKPLDIYLSGSGNGTPNIYEVYPNYRLVGANGKPFQAMREEIEIYRANPEVYPYYPFFKLRAATLGDMDNAIKQNLDAIKQMTLIKSKSPTLTKQLLNADKKRRAGVSVAVIAQAQEDFAELTTLQTGGDYYITNLLADRRKLYEDTLHMCGIRTPQEKAERLITSEVTAQSEETDSYIGTIITTVNEDSKVQNGALTAYRKRADGIPDSEYSEVMTGQEKNEEGAENGNDL